MANAPSYVSGNVTSASLLDVFAWSVSLEPTGEEGILTRRGPLEVSAVTLKSPPLEEAEKRLILLSKILRGRLMKITTPEEMFPLIASNHTQFRGAAIGVGEIYIHFDRAIGGL